MSGHRHTPWIQWHPDQNEYSQALREGPTAALDRFRTLFHNRASVFITSENDELLLLSEVLAEQFELLHDETIDTNEELWRASIESEFMLFLITVITEPAFFKHHLMFTVYICRMLLATFQMWANVTHNESDDDAIYRKTIWRVPASLNEAVWSATEAMWISLWDRRSELARLFGSRVGRAISMSFDSIAFLTQKLRNRIFMHEDTNPVMVKVAYCSWVYLHGSELFSEADEIELPSFHHAIMLVHEHCTILHRTDDGSSAVPQAHGFMAELANATDTETLVRAARNALSHSTSLVDEHLSVYIYLLLLQMKAIGHLGYASQPLLEALALAVNRQLHTANPKPNPLTPLRREMEVRGLVYEHIQAMLPGLKARVIPSTSFPGNRLWDILVDGLCPAWLIDSHLSYVPGQCVCGDHAEVAEDLSTFIDKLVQLVDSLASEIRSSHLPQAVIDDIRDSGVKPRVSQVIGVWYTEARRLHHVAKKTPSSTTCATLLATWVKLGDALGIDEASQRNLEAAHRARQCSWHLCVHHSTPSEKPLLVCKGCMEARYCSTACQRSDWKEGGHRTNCRRVK